MHKGAILPLFYLPPAEYFAALVSHREELILDRHEHFPKQTYRNRASVQSPNGRLELVIPVVKGSKTHTPVKDVRISYDFEWQRLHWMSLQSCYRSSAYFEFYEDAFVPFYEERKDVFLFDYNLHLLELLLKLLKLDISTRFTESYQKEHSGLEDYRQSIHPKHSSGYEVKEYFQVFGERNGFMNNLSIVDLLFSQGPQSPRYL